MEDLQSEYLSSLENYLLKDKKNTELDFINEYLEKYRISNLEYEKIKNLNDAETLEHIIKVNYRNYNYLKNQVTEDEIIKDFRYYYPLKEPSYVSTIPQFFFEHKLKVLEHKSKNKRETTSLNFDGRRLNLSERLQIANKLFSLESKIRKLDIQEAQKHQLLSHILGCHEDNAKDLMNGKYHSKDRDLTGYFKNFNLDK